MLLGAIPTVLMILLIAGLVGFGVLTNVTAGVVQLVFFVFLIALVVSFVAHYMRQASR